MSLRKKDKTGGGSSYETSWRGGEEGMGTMGKRPDEHCKVIRWVGVGGGLLKRDECEPELTF